MSELRGNRKAILVLLVVCFLVSATSGEVIAQKGAPLAQNNMGGATAQGPTGLGTIITVTDRDWSSSSSTSDCAQGWASDEWRLILSQPKTVRLRVDDCCCPGDYYAVYVNGSLLGATPKPAVWGCHYSGSLSSGTFDIFLPTGTHRIQVRDASFTDHTAQEIGYERMCPAGFTLAGTLLTPPSIPDVALQAASWEFDNSTSPYQPEKFWLSVTAANIGTAAANNVTVRFYLGNPDGGGTQIGTAQVLGTIQPSAQAKATTEWTLTGNVENQTLYARASATSDANAANNTVSKTVSVWYIPFWHNRDAYSFVNWSLEWQDIKNDLAMFLDSNHPDDALAAVLFPVLYPLWSMFLENGGHCYGMSAASSLYYQFPEIKPVSKTTYGMTKEEARSDIQNYHRTQTTYIMEAIITGNSGCDPVAEYNTVRSSLRDAHRPIMLLMQSSTGGHAVVANKVLDLGDEKRIYVYDNNRPLDSMSSALYAAVNAKTKTFLYGSGYDQFVARPALLTVPDGAKVVVKRFYDWVLSQILRLGQIRVSVGPSTASGSATVAGDGSAALGSEAVAIPLITDQYGRRIGYVDGNLINEIPGASLATVGEHTVLDLPDDLQYTVGVHGSSSGHMALSFLIPENSEVVREVGYLDVPASAGSTASVALRKGNTDWTLVNTGQAPQQPDSLVDTRFYQAYLPVVTRGPSCGGQMLVNPGFEQGAGAGWSASSATGRSLIYAAGFPTPVSPHSGGWAAWLGGADREVASLSQTITPPAGAISATLTYWYWIQSSESSCTYDHAWVEVNGGLLRLHDLCASGNTSGWRQVTLDLTPYLGHPIGLRFYVDTDSSLLSHFFVDDVSLNVQCGGQ